MVASVGKMVVCATDLELLLMHQKKCFRFATTLEIYTRYISVSMAILVVPCVSLMAFHSRETSHDLV